MLRVGHGFSKMLSQLKPDMSKITEQKQVRPSSGRNLSQDPNVCKTVDLQHVSSSLGDFDKTGASDMQNASNLIKKTSKIKVTKPLLESKDGPLQAHTIQQTKTKKSHLPKIESSRNL